VPGKIHLRAKYEKRSGIDFRLVALRGEVMRRDYRLSQAQSPITGRHFAVRENLESLSA